jgi:hypothetical protein
MGKNTVLFVIWQLINFIAKKDGYLHNQKTFFIFALHFEEGIKAALPVASHLPD